MNNNRILDALNGKKTKTPIWLMRQAGRYLPEYKILREKCGSFLNLCYSTDAIEVTMQPIRRFDFDAAIIFSDILIVPHSLGLNLDFVQGDGPILERIIEERDLKKLKISKNNWQFDKIWETVSGVRKELQKNKALIGFAGAPWTVATYILEGRGKTNFEFSKNIAKTNPNFVKDLLEIIVEQTIYYLLGQIAAGAGVIQIFDSWAGVLNNHKNYEKFIIDPVAKITSEIKKIYPEVKIICFPKGINNLENYVKNIELDGISIGSEVDLKTAKNLQKFSLVQGNLDPEILVSSKENIEKETKEILDKLSGKKFIFNLGHGILQTTPIENVEFLVDLVRNHGR